MVKAGESRAAFFKGVAAIVASAFGFAAMAFCVRYADHLGTPIPAVEKSVFRNLVAVAVAAVVFCRSTDSRPGLKRLMADSAARRLMLCRALFGTLGIFANFYALSHIPIAEGMMLNKTAPFFTVLMSAFVFRERVSRRQLLAILWAVFGVLLVLRPGVRLGDFWPLMSGIAGGLCAGMAYSCLRQLGVLGIPGAVVVLLFSAMSTLVALPCLWLSAVSINLAQLLVLLGAGAGAALGQFGITAAYRLAPPREIAVFDYSNVIFTALFGLVFLGQVPDLWALAGFLVIVLSFGLTRK